VLARAFEVEAGAYDRERQVPVGVGDTGSPFDELGIGTPDFGVDFSAPARGLAVWAILSEIGSDGVRERIVRHKRLRPPCCPSGPALPTRSNCSPSRNSAFAASATDPPGWDDEGRLDALNEAVIRGIRARGRTVTSSTRVGGRFAIRPCFINPRATLADADALVDEVLAVGRDLAAPHEQ
jgi:glutamate/tyrosine decarboxylase-like PLP-dependent enzyme